MALARGDILMAARYNLLVLCLLPFGALLACLKARQYVRTGQTPMGKAELVFYIVAFLLCVIFFIVRNQWNQRPTNPVGRIFISAAQPPQKFDVRKAIPIGLISPLNLYTKWEKTGRIIDALPFLWYYCRVYWGSNVYLPANTSENSESSQFQVIFFDRWCNARKEDFYQLLA